jgi:hypothetical protein
MMFWPTETMSQNKSFFKLFMLGIFSQPQESNDIEKWYHRSGVL